MKVFVTVGTGAFNDLIKAVDKMKLNAKMQIGKGRYIPRNHDYFRFSQDLTPYYQWADIIIAHGGAAITFEALKSGKKLISIANPNRTDDHQNQILTELSLQGHLIYCKADELQQAINHAVKKRFVQYKPPVCHIPQIINQWLRH